jgi:hypothetical protein
MFIEAEIGFMVRYTIENNKYEGNRINYSSCESPKLTSTTLNTNVITWDRLVTKTRHTTSLDTIPGTTSTTRVDITQTYKCEIYTFTAMTSVNKDEYMSFYVARKTASYTPPNYNAEDGYANREYTDSYTAIISDAVPNGKVSITVQNGYKNQSTWSSSRSWSYSTTSQSYVYEVSTYMSTMIYPIGNIFTTMGVPKIVTNTKYVKYITNLSSSSSSSSKEIEPVHNIGTSSISIPLAVGYTVLTSASTVITSYTPVVTDGQTTIQTLFINSSTESTIVNGNSGSIAFTTLGGLPKLDVLLSNSIINSAYVSFQNYNVESSIFYLGTLNVNVTTKITSEREV